MSGVVQLRLVWRRRVQLVLAFGVGLLPAASALAQEGASPSAPGTDSRQRLQEIIPVAVGNSTVLERPVALRRVVTTNPEIAEAMVISGNEIVIHGRSVGTTSLLMWNVQGEREQYSIVVTPDAGAVEQHLRSLFPGEQLSVSAIGKALVLSGQVSDARVAKQIRDITRAAGFEVADRLFVPTPDQVMLRVRLAEVSRNALREVGVQFLFDRDGRVTVAGADRAGLPIEDGQFRGTFSDALGLFLFHPDLDLAAFIRALESRGIFRSLAEPNLLTIDGEEASFLAGGEFPYPVVQGGGGDNPAVSIAFREFGVRLDFTPVVTQAGNIRLHVRPEVSTLDFANGLQVSGFRVPTVLARRAETEVELRNGQTLAIAGLIDNSITDNIDQVPLLGSIPILGALFRSKELRQRRTELVVLVTPHIIQPTEASPPLPTGEPEQWKWLSPLKDKPGEN